jgi:diguanylate cyclase (GGDEF)-like protein
MRSFVTVNRYCVGIIIAACAATGALLPTAHFGYISSNPLTFGLLFGGLTLGELLPVKIPRRGGDEEVTLSTSFTFALLLLSGGLGPALIAQSSASAIQDIVARKPWYRVAFNVAQYALSMAGALLVIRLLSDTSGAGTPHPFKGQDLPAILHGSGTFFAINTGIVGMAIALHKKVPILPYFRNDAIFVFVTGNVLLFLAPIVVAATVYSPVLLPLFAAPILAIYNAGRQAVRSEHAAHHDSLTGLPNRMAFHEVVTGAIQDGDAGRCGVLLMDLDRFKDVNDTLGHRYGDLLLQQVASRLLEHVGDDGCIARLGGDEFAIFTRCKSTDDAVEVAQLVADTLRSPFELDQIVVDTQASLGIALFPDDGEDIETLLQKADVAMYRAKETHTDVAVYEERHDHHSPAKLALTADLRAAVDNEEIVVWYQPILDLESCEVRAVEALVRWQHPDLGLLLPGSFIDMAEHTNLIKPLTHRVLELSLAQLAQWDALGIQVSVAVNVSTRVLVDRDFTSRVTEALGKARISPTRLKLEVTESTLMADPTTARTVLQDLDSRGIDIAIDDFGTGYSSLAYLADLPVAEVKIDRSFVSRMTTRSDEAIIVNSTIDLAHNLGLRSVAEGVEDLGLLPDLQALGCDAAQGYAISRPLSSENATRWLLTSARDLRLDRRLRSVA